MTAESDETTTVYQCVVCGPCLRLEDEDRNITIHRNVPHPDGMTFDEESNPQ